MLIVVEWLKIFNVFVFKFSLNWYIHESTVNPWKMISLWWINDFCNKIWSFLQLNWTKVSEEWYPYLQLEKRTDPGVIFKCSKYFWYAPGQTANVKMPRMEKNMLTIPNTIPPLRKSKQQQHRDVFRQSSNVNMANWKWKKGKRVSISLLYRINQQQSKQPIIKHIHNAFTPNAGSTHQMANPPLLMTSTFFSIAFAWIDYYYSTPSTWTAHADLPIKWNELRISLQSFLTFFFQEAKTYQQGQNYLLICVMCTV